MAKAKAKYKFFGPERSNGVETDTMTIPADEQNKEWIKFLEWEAEGNTAEPHLTPAEIEEKRVEKERLKAIGDKKKVAGFKKTTVEAAEAFVEDKLSKTSLSNKDKGLLADIFNSIVPYILD